MLSHSFRRILSSFLFRNPRIEAVLNLLDSLFSIWSCVSFVLQSYLSPTSEKAHANAAAISAIDDVDFVVSIFFALEFFKDFILARSKRAFVTTAATWIDGVTTFPQIIIFIMSSVGSSAPGADAAANLSFLRFFRILKILNLNRVTRGINKGKPAGLIQSQINELALTVIAAVFIFAGSFQMIEQIFVSDERLSVGAQGDLDFTNALYFTVTTVATVGYGDIVPISIFGKGILIVLLIFMFSVVSRKMSTINMLMSKQSKYERASYSFSSPHVIICGGIDTVHLDSFLRELFHKDHLQPDEASVRVVICAPRDPDFEVLNIVSHTAFADRIVYMNGNLIEEDDMIRARAHKAKAMFIFCSQREGTNPDQDDSAVLLQSMALQSFVHKQQATMPRIIAMVNFSLSLRRFNAIMRKSSDITADKHQIVCLEELKPALMVQGCINPGFISLSYSTIRSFTLTDIMTKEQRNSPGLLPQWQRELINGMDYELYSTFLAPSFSGMTFAATAAMLYETLNVFLLAVEIDGSTYLAPLTHIFSAAGATIHILASSANHAVQVSEMTPPKHVEEDEQQQGDRRSFLFAKLQSAAKRVKLMSSVTHVFSKRPDVTPASVAEREGSGAGSIGAPTPEQKDLSPFWKMLSRGVRTGTALRNMRNNSNTESSQFISKDSYQFLLQNERNPKFARLEAKKSFLVLDEDISFASARIRRFDGYGHIVFCCKNESASGSLGRSLKRFIAPLRSKASVCVHTPVVVLAHTMTSKDFEAVAMYPNVFVVIGNPLVIDDLRRAGVVSAKYAVVCSQFSPRTSVRGSEKDESNAADNAAIFVGNLIRKLNSQCTVVVELQYSRNVKFVGSNLKENLEIGVATASGSYFSLQYFHVLMCRCFYAPFCLSLLQECLRPHPTFISGQSHTSGTSIVSSVEVPQNFVGCSFGLLFKTCASIGIPIAIQRVPTMFNAAQDKYIVACPRFSLRLNQGDRIILLSPLPAKDLEEAFGKQSDFKVGMEQYQENPADKWQKIYQSVDKGDDSAAANSLSSEVQLVKVSNFDCVH